MDYAHDGYLYIASPYTHDDPVIRQRRFEKALDFTAWLAKTYRMWGYSPIVHSHWMAVSHDMPAPIDFWEDWDKCMIRTCVGLVVLQIDGWNKSRGIDIEVDYARAIGKPTYYSTKLWGALYDHSI